MTSHGSWLCRAEPPLVGAAALSTAAGYILYFRLLSTAGATNLLLVTFLIPVSAILLGVFVLGEAFLLKHAFGMAMIGVGLTAIDGRPWRLAKELLAPRAQIDQPNADGGGI